jgi:hypothetical protein
MKEATVKGVWVWVWVCMGECEMSGCSCPRTSKSHSAHVVSMLEVMIMDGSVWFQSKEVRGAQYSLPLDCTAQEHKPHGSQGSRVRRAPAQIPHIHHTRMPRGEKSWVG